MVSGVREGSAKHDDRGIHQAHARGQHTSDDSPRLAHFSHSVDVPTPDGGDDGRRAFDIRAPRPQLRGDRRTCGDSFQASVRTAPTLHAVGLGNPNMTDVAGDTLRSAVHAAANNDTGADARGHLDKEEVCHI